MSKKINVRGLTDNSDDPFYRYKMEKISCTDQKGKTVINNIDAIAKAINRDPKKMIDYFKKRVGTGMTFKDGKVMISKKITTDELEKLLFEFIEYFVLCPTCRNPETILASTTSGKIEMSCKACSYLGGMH